MGVPGIFRIILEKYNKCHQKIGDQSMDDLYMDFNPIIYSAYYRAIASYGYDHLSKLNIEQLEQIIINLTVDKAVDIVEIVKPSRLLYIAIDGPAPRSKMVQQRSRRYRKIVETERKCEIQKKYKAYKKELWDTSNITPGTEFMIKLSKALNRACKKGRFGKIKVVINDASFPGEGEHKFLRSIERLDFSIKNVAIFSNDGDLLILGNRFSGDRNIYILTEPNKTSEIVKKYYMDQPYMYVILPEFKKV